MTPLSRIKEIAKNKGLSLQKIAEEAGIGVNSIYRWSTKTPSTSSLQKVADVLNVSVDYLLGNTDEMIPNKKDSSEPAEVDLAKDPVILSLDGMELSDDYRAFIIDQIRSLRKMRGDE